MGLCTVFQRVLIKELLKQSIVSDDMAQCHLPCSLFITSYDRWLPQRGAGEKFAEHSNAANS